MSGTDSKFKTVEIPVYLLRDHEVADLLERCSQIRHTYLAAGGDARDIVEMNPVIETLFGELEIRESKGKPGEDFVYQVTVDGKPGGAVSRHLGQAVMHAFFKLCPSPAEREALANRTKHPVLTAAGLGGSREHRARWAFQDRAGSVRVVRHDTLVAPGTDSAVAHYELVDAFDPSFALQSALYRTEEEETPLDQIADDLEDRADAATFHLKGQGRDGQVVDQWRDLEYLLGGVAAVPEDGDPSEIVAGIGKHLRNRFLDLAQACFPERGAPKP